MKFFTKRFDTATMQTMFAAACPFPHVVIDNAFDSDALQELVERYPKVEDKSWWHYDNPLERKFAFNDLSQLDPVFSSFFNEANSSEVITQLSKLSGLENLIPDPSLYGGGLHQIAPGGKLDVHEDFNIHLEMRALRKLNLIVYLNDHWEESYGGHLQLWNADMTKCEASILPVYNRAVIFRTDTSSNHGHPDPLTSPAGVTRRSLATYYYTPMTNEEWASRVYTSTQYKKRPNDVDDPKMTEMRLKRNSGRLENKTSK